MERLRALMDRHGLKKAGVAEILEVSERTVFRWFAPRGSDSFVECPVHMVDALEFRLQRRKNR